MRKVTFGGANSLDNYIAGKDENIDWLLWSKETGAMMKDYWKKIDTVVMGRKTYEFAMKNAPTGASSGGKIKTYVCSRKLEKVDGDNVQLERDAVKLVRRLKEEKGKEICIMGGGLLAKSLFEAGLIDEIGFNVHPVLLGSGIPLFHKMKQQINLELADCKQLSNGCVVLTYRVLH
jgi:dihydrofolate reductase